MTRRLLLAALLALGLTAAAGGCRSANQTAVPGSWKPPAGAY